MNYKRVLSGGLLAGVVFVIADALFPMVFRVHAEAWLNQLGFSAPSGAGLAAALVLVLGLGIVAVWLYAAIRPRYGSGFQTAMIAGLAIWVLVVAFPSLSFATLGMPVDAGFWIYMIWWLVFAPLGTVAGAWAYQEIGEGDVAAAPAMAPAGDE